MPKGEIVETPHQSDGEHEDRQRTPHARKTEILNGNASADWDTTRIKTSKATLWGCSKEWLDCKCFQKAEEAASNRILRGILHKGCHATMQVQVS